MKQTKSLNNLIHELNSKNADVRANAAKDLGWKQNREAIQPLIKVTKDKSEDVRELALWALSNIALVHPRTSELLQGESIFRKMLKDQNWYLRCYGAVLLGEIDSVVAIPNLIDGLGDECIDVRYAVAAALGEMKSDISSQQTSKIIKMLVGNAKERHGAMIALAAIKYPKMISILLTCMEDKEAIIREDAVEILGQRKTKQVIFALMSALDDVDGNIREKAIQALVKMEDKQIIHALIKALKDDYWVVQIEAAEGLGKIGDKKALPALLEILGDEEVDENSDDPFEMVRVAALKAIRHIKS